MQNIQVAVTILTTSATKLARAATFLIIIASMDLMLIYICKDIKQNFYDKLQKNL
tara:strand:+ start:132 stop:296 length:165 start_codon:yes stop_codon:yes gene_type:complete